MEPTLFARYLTTFSELVESLRPSFQRYFWIATSVYASLIVVLGVQLPVESFAGALIISIAALAPWYLWVTGIAKGLPIWPMFTLTALWAYALPLVTEHPVVIQFPPIFQLLGSVLVTAFLVVGTLCWLPFARREHAAPLQVRVLPMQRGRLLFFAFLVAGLALIFVTSTDSLDTSGNFFSVVRAFALGLSSLSIFYFGYQMGAHQLRPTEQVAFFVLLILSIVVSITSMLLVNGMSMILLAFISYFLGRGRIPWLPFILTALTFYFLHAGKSEQRDQYWGEMMWRPIKTDEYPKFFSDWIGHSTNALSEQLGLSKERRDPGQVQNKIWERSSLMHLVLYIMYATPDAIPFLNGETYAVIPQLLIPRFLFEEKLGSHFGNTLMAVQYGIVDADDESGTSIGFGLISEAYANFGYFGCLAAAVLVGSAAGWVTRWSMSVPIMSFRFLFGVLCLSSAFQVEYTAGVLVSSLFQSTVALAVVALLFMKVLPVERVRRLMPSLMEEDARPVKQPAITS